MSGSKARYALDRPYVLWVGTLEPRKNLPTLFEAYRRLGQLDEDLVIVGPPVGAPSSSTWSPTWGIASATSASCQPRTSPRSTPARGAFCFPSIREGFGLPLLEAMSQGCP